MDRSEMRNGALYYHWNNQSIPVVNLNKRFGIETDFSTHQVILDGSKKRSDSRIMVVVGEVTGIVDLEDDMFQPVQPLVGEFSKLVDAVFVLKDTNWLRIRQEYFY
jgi:chemotaxis signal transduction protein